MARKVVIKKGGSTPGKELVPVKGLAGALVHVSKKPGSSQAEILEQVGLTGLKRSYGVVFEEFLPELQGQNAIRVYKEMRDNEPVIGGMFFAIEMFLRKVKWFIDPAGDDDKAKADAQFLAECKDDMSHTWADFVSEIMSMMQYGWSYFEIVYKIRDKEDVNEEGEPRSEYDDGKYGWRKIELRSQDTLDRWRFDDDGGIAGLWQFAPPNYTHAFLPIQKCLLFRTESKKNNPEGRSVLRNAYRPWYFKKRMEEIEGVGVERDLAGLPFAEVPAEMMSPNASDEDKATLASIVDLVKNIRRDEQEGIVWPQSWDSSGNPQYKFQLLNSGGTRQFETDKIITRYELRMALVILADIILMGTETQGSFALSTTKSGLFQAALGAWLDMIQGVLNNYAVPRLFRLNRIDGPYPKFRHEEVQQVPLADLATFLSALAGAGAQLFPDTNLENHIRGLAQLPLREEEDEYIEREQEVREVELEQQREMARAQIKQAKQGIMPGMAQPGQPGQQNGQRKVPGSPTKSTGPTKSKLPPQSRRRTKAVNASENVKKRNITSTVKAYLAQNYPERVLGWVDRANWKGPVLVPLREIDMSRRPGGRNMTKVRNIAEAVEQGKKMEPVVLVKNGNGGMKVADGYHRTLGFKHAGKTAIRAYIGEVSSENGAWDKRMHAAKLNKRHKNPEAEAETQRIRARRVRPANMRPHKFKAAEWTHPNGHPRCARCGGEERIGGICDPRKDGWLAQ